MKKELLTVKELAMEPHMLEVDPAWVSISVAVVSLLSRCCTWIHLITYGYIGLIPLISAGRYGQHRYAH